MSHLKTIDVKLGKNMGEMRVTALAKYKGIKTDELLKNADTLACLIYHYGAPGVKNIKTYDQHLGEKAQKSEGRLKYFVK